MSRRYNTCLGGFAVGWVQGLSTRVLNTIRSYVSTRMVILLLCACALQIRYTKQAKVRRRQPKASIIHYIVEDENEVRPSRCIHSDFSALICTYMFVNIIGNQSKSCTQIMHNWMLSGSPLLIFPRSLPRICPAISRRLCLRSRMSTR